MDWNILIQTIASIATALGVAIGAEQIHRTKKQAQTQFEDRLTEQYREIIKEIPVWALLGAELTEDKANEAFGDFYCYIDLTNEQVFLRQIGRVSDKTWPQWRDGIRSQLKRHEFASAWQIIKSEVPNDFQELQMLEFKEFDTDPKDWKDFDKFWLELTKLRKERDAQEKLCKPDALT